MCIAAHANWTFLSFIFKGPAAPQPPMGLRFINTSFTSAVIEWKVLSIAYTPESYQVMLGTQQNALNQSGMLIMGGNNLTATNQVFTAELFGLMPDTIYYYQITAVNSHSSTESSIASFVTVPIRKLSYHWQLFHPLLL